MSPNHWEPFVYVFLQSNDYARLRVFLFLNSEKTEQKCLSSVTQAQFFADFMVTMIDTHSLSMKNSKMVNIIHVINRQSSIIKPTS